MSLFRRKPKPDPLIRWYGKLPVYGDYYDSGSGGDWVAEFTQKWLMKGFEVYEQRRHGAAPPGPAPGRDHRPAHRLPDSACILQLPQSGMTVLASCLDFGGDIVGRRFPLCFFVGLPAADWPGPTHGSVLPAMDVLSQLLHLGKRVVRFLNDPGLKGPEQFRDQFADREVTLDHLAVPLNGWTDRARTVRLTDWYAVVGETLGAPDLDAWLRRTARWGERITQADSPGFKATLSFPLVPEQAPGTPRIDRGIQIAGWLRWLEGRMELKGRPLSLVIADEHTPARSRLTIIAGELTPEDFLLLTPLASELKHVDDLAALREESPGENPPLDESPTSTGDSPAGASASGPLCEQASAAVVQCPTTRPADANVALEPADGSSPQSATLTWADFVLADSQVGLKV